MKTKENIPRLMTISKFGLWYPELWCTWLLDNQILFTFMTNLFRQNTN
jgi:hypothetical protein